jgi:hypothetical protein
MFKKSRQIVYIFLQYNRKWMKSKKNAAANLPDNLLAFRELVSFNLQGSR